MRNRLSIIYAVNDLINKLLEYGDDDDFTSECASRVLNYIPFEDYEIEDWCGYNRDNCENDDK